MKLSEVLEGKMIPKPEQFIEYGAGTLAFVLEITDSEVIACNARGNIHKWDHYGHHLKNSVFDMLPAIHSINFDTQDGFNLRVMCLNKRVSLDFDIDPRSDYAGKKQFFIGDNGPTLKRQADSLIRVRLHDGEILLEKLV